MNRTSLLLGDIKEQLAKDFTGFTLRAPASNGRLLDSGGEELYREPSVFVGGFPKRRADKPIAPRRRLKEEPEQDDSASLVPFAMVRLFDYFMPDDDFRKVIANVGIVFTVYVGDAGRESAMNDLLNVGDRIFISMSRDRFWGDDRWQLLPPMHMIQGTGRAETIYDSGLQGHGPYFGGAIVAQFWTKAPDVAMPQEFDSDI